jgi:hypothetical protein
MIIDDDTPKELLRIDDEFMRLCKWLNEKGGVEKFRLASSRWWMISRTFCWKREKATNCTDSHGSRHEQVTPIKSLHK